jgi:hypothetical protein
MRASSGVELPQPESKRVKDALTTSALIAVAENIDIFTV